MFRILNYAFLFVVLSSAAVAQPEALVIRNTVLPKAYFRQAYHVPLVVQGGVPPFTWKLSSGSLPSGMAVEANGALDGTPAQVGEFPFVVTVTDNGNPAHQRDQSLVLRVVAPLLAQWSHPPKVSGRRIDGSVKMSNETEQDFDLTFVVLAVNEIGRATAIGYQHFTLKKDTIDFEVPFGENLPSGTYLVNADVVAEVAETNSIHRARLVSNGKLQILLGP